MRTLTLYAIVGLAMTSFCIGEPKEPQDALDELSARYRNASTERQRLNICIDAIDRDLISVGAAVKTVDRLFGTHFERDIPSKGSLKRGVFFTDSITPFEESPTAAPKGWTLIVEFDSDGRIVSYLLSKL